MSNGSNRSWLFYQIDAGTIRFLASATGQGTDFVLDLPFAPVTGQSYDLAYSVDSLDGTVRIFADGIFLGSGVLPFTTHAAAQPLEIGATAGNSIPCGHSWDALRITSAPRLVDEGGYTPINPFV